MKLSTGLELVGSCISFVGNIIDTIGDDEVKAKAVEMISKIKAPKLPKE